MISLTLQQTGTRKLEELDLLGGISTLKKDPDALKPRLSIERLPKVRRVKKRSINLDVPDPEKRLKPLAIWTSLIAARAMSSFIEANYQSIHHPELKFVSWDDLAFQEKSMGDEYELIFMGIYEKDACGNAASNALKKLARRGKSSNPLTVCYSGGFNSNGAQKWFRLIEDLKQSVLSIKCSGF